MWAVYFHGGLKLVIAYTLALLAFYIGIPALVFFIANRYPRKKKK
jgi:hypothetical protein